MKISYPDKTPASTSIFPGSKYEFKIIYIAGPMTGYPDFNFQAFDDAKNYLKQKGWAVVSPADLAREEGFREEGLNGDPLDIQFALLIAKKDINALLKCDAVYLLRGWENSKGARAEKAVAEWVGLPCVEQEWSHEHRDEEFSLRRELFKDCYKGCF
jgi:hypothetical protein